MPTIKKIKRKPSPRTQERQKYYQMKQWRNLSEWYRMTHPLCELCMEHGRITPSVHCHHILSPFDTSISDVEKMARLMNPDNLMSVCADCHNFLHGNFKKPI